MARVARKLNDRKILKLIRSYLASMGPDRSEITDQMELRWHGARTLEGCSPGLHDAT